MLHSIILIPPTRGWGGGASPNDPLAREEGGWEGGGRVGRTDGRTKREGEGKDGGREGRTDGRTDGR